MKSVYIWQDYSLNPVKVTSSFYKGLKVMANNEGVLHLYKYGSCLFIYTKREYLAFIK